MRCRIGPRKLRFYGRMFNKTFCLGLVRGNTEHRVDLFERDIRTEKSWSYYPKEKELILNYERPWTPGGVD